MSPRPEPRSPRRGRRTAMAVGALALGTGLVGPALAAPAPERAPVAPSAPTVALAPPSPDLPGLPSMSMELAQVAVEGREFGRAEAAYQTVDGELTTRQAARVDIDRSITALTAERDRLDAELAAAEARRAGLQARLDDVSAAIADLGIDLYITDGSAARVDAALVTENPSINDEDRREVLGAASLDVLLAEKAAYQARLDEVTARSDAARTAVQALTREAAALGKDRPGAAQAEAAAAAPVAAARVAYEDARVLARVKGVEFPLVALDAYYRAARTVATEAPACGVRWWGVAGISRVEGHHGTYGGAALDEDGNPSKRIVGIPLDGTNETRVVGDTDGGALDGDAGFDRAVGPMQFIPETWRRFAADGNADGAEDPFNLYDAALAAARYLCHASGGLDADGGLRSAYFSYNQSLAYVESVLGYARLYERSIDVPEPLHEAARESS